MKINLDQSVNHRIATLAVLLKRQVFRLISKNNLAITPDQWVILYYLWEDDGMPVGSLAAKSKKDFATTTRIIDNLVKMEYIEKRKSSNDSRVTTIHLLPKAELIRNPVAKIWEESTIIAMNGISASEKLILLDLLDKIERNVMAQK
jgi:DNA-binding MarR family transcriptional regulator